MTLLDTSDLGTVLTVWAHPDDEAYLAGGLLAALTDAGQRVVCVTATRGEAADPGATPLQAAALADVRTAELETSLAVLGVTEHQWLDHPDGACAAVDPADPAAALATLLAELRPDTVVTFGPDGFTGHPDHRAVSGWVDLAVEAYARPVRLLHAVLQRELVDLELVEQFDVYALGEPRMCSDAELSVRLPLGGARLQRKVAALVAQTSQTSGLIAAVGIERFSAWVATECFAAPG